MRRTEPLRFGDAWDEFLRRTPSVARKIMQAKIPDVWPTVVGPALAAYTSGIELSGGVLTVRVVSSVVRNELFMQRESLRVRLNEALGFDMVKVIIVK